MATDQIFDPESNVTPMGGAALGLPAATAGAKPQTMGFRDRLKAGAAAGAKFRESLPPVLQRLFDASPLGLAANQVAGIVAAGEKIGETAARVANPYGMALYSALDTAPTFDAGMEAAAQLGNRGAKPSPKAEPPAPPTAEPAVVTPAQAQRPSRAPLLPQTINPNINAGLASVAQYIVDVGHARAEERAEARQVDAAKALAAAYKPKTEFEADPVTGEIKSVAIYDPATGKGAKKPVKTELDAATKQAMLAEAQAKYAAGADLATIQAELAKHGVTSFVPRK